MYIYILYKYEKLIVCCLKMVITLFFLYGEKVYCMEQDTKTRIVIDLDPTSLLIGFGLGVFIATGTYIWYNYSTISTYFFKENPKTYDPEELEKRLEALRQSAEEEPPVETPMVVDAPREFDREAAWERLRLDYQNRENARLQNSSVVAESYSDTTTVQESTTINPQEVVVIPTINPFVVDVHNMDYERYNNLRLWFHNYRLEHLDVINNKKYLWLNYKWQEMEQHFYYLSKATYPIEANILKQTNYINEDFIQMINMMHGLGVSTEPQLLEVIADAVSLFNS